MRNIVLIVFLLYLKLTCAQVKGYAELSQSLHRIPFTTTNVAFGMSIFMKRGVFTVAGLYQFGGNFKQKDNSLYEMNFHLLGIETKYRFRNSSKIYSPTVQFNVSTEIGSSYRGGKLRTHPTSNTYNFAPSTSYVTEYISYGGETPHASHNYVNYYVSTPIIIGVIIGHDFRLAKNLFFNLGLGYSARAVNARIKKWGINQPESISDISSTHSMKEVKWFHSLDLNIGFNYAFSLKKKSN